MGAISSFGRSLGSTFKNPKYVVVVVISAILYGVLGGVLGPIPFIGQLVFFFLVVPALNAGIIGMAYAINEYGGASLSSYTDSVKENIGSMAVAYLVTGIIQGILFFLLTVVVGIIGVVVGGGVISQLGGPDQIAQDPQALVGLVTSAGVILLLVFLLWFVLLGLLFMLFQFIGPAIVVGGRGVGSAIKKSVGIFTSHPLSVIGYTLLRGLSFGIIVAIPLVIVGMGALDSAGTGVNTTSPMVGIGGLLAVISFPLAYAFFMMYHTTYYYDVTDGDPEGGQPAPQAGGAPGPQQGAPQGPGTPQQGARGQPQQGGQYQAQQQQGRGHQQGRGPQQGGQPRGNQGGHQARGGQGGHQQQGHGGQPRGNQPRGGQQGPGGHQQGGQPRGNQGGQPQGTQPRGGQPQGGQGGQPQGDHGNQPQGGQDGRPQGGHGNQPQGGQNDRPQGNQPQDAPPTDDSQGEQSPADEEDEDDDRYREF